MPPFRALLLALAIVASACAPALDAGLTSDLAVARAPVPPPATSPSPSPPSPTADEDPLAGLPTALEAAAQAFRSGDPDLLRPWLDDPGSPFGRRWLERAENLREVPLSTYDLELADTLRDITTGSVRRRIGDEARVVRVVERHGLDGHDDRGPAEEDLYLTVVRRAGGWRFVGDDDAEPLGLVSADHLWDHGPVVATSDGPVLALHHPGNAARIATVLSETRAAIGDVRRSWPLEWEDRVAVVIPDDEEELGELLHVTFDLTNFVAFATATPTGDLGHYELTGARVLLNTRRFLARQSSTRRSILAHELLHVATRPHSGPHVPAWVEEGVAQRLGERRSTTGTSALDALVVGGGAVDLPEDADFTTGDRSSIFLSYQLAWSFADHLADTYGEEALARFYEELGRGAVGEPGLLRYHLGRAARAVYGRSFEELTAEWRSSLS